QYRGHRRALPEAAAQSPRHVVFAASLPHRELAGGVDAPFAGVETRHAFAQTQTIRAPVRPWKVDRRHVSRPSLKDNVQHRASVQALHDAVLKQFGKIDILVNAAGVTHKAPTLEESEQEWSRVIETNLTGTLRACQIFGNSMVQARYGRIINIASLTTFLGF